MMLVDVYVCTMSWCKRIKIKGPHIFQGYTDVLLIMQKDSFETLMQISFPSLPIPHGTLELLIMGDKLDYLSGPKERERTGQGRRREDTLLRY
jgi:hypothetical protein